MAAGYCLKYPKKVFNLAFFRIRAWIQSAKIIFNHPTIPSGSKKFLSRTLRDAKLF